MMKLDELEVGMNVEVVGGCLLSFSGGKRRTGIWLQANVTRIDLSTPSCPIIELIIKHQSGDVSGCFRTLDELRRPRMKLTEKVENVKEILQLGANSEELACYKRSRRRLRIVVSIESGIIAIGLLNLLL